MDKTSSIGKWTADLLNRVEKHREVMEAFLEGSEIECRFRDGPWRPSQSPTWSTDIDYRIKAEPESRWLVSRKNFGRKIENIFSDESRAKLLVQRLENENLERVTPISTDIKLIKLTEDRSGE